MAKTVMITLVKSPIGRLPKQRATLQLMQQNGIYDHL